MYSRCEVGCGSSPIESDDTAQEYRCPKLSRTPEKLSIKPQDQFLANISVHKQVLDFQLQTPVKDRFKDPCV